MKKIIQLNVEIPEQTFRDLEKYHSETGVAKKKAVEKALKMLFGRQYV